MDFNAIDRIRKQLKEQKSIIVKAFASVDLFSKEFIQKIGTIQDVIQTFSKNYSDIITKIIEATKNIDWEGFEKFAEEFGWLEAIYMTYGFKLEEILKNEGKEKVWEKLIQDLNDEELLNELNRDIFENKLLKDRSRILAKVLEHHKNKDFISSIPLMLSQIEGIIWDLGVYKKIVENRTNSKYKIDINRKCILDSKGKKIEWRLGEIMRYLFGKDSKLIEYTKENIYSKELRHPVLHGRQTDYDNAQSSTMLVLLLIAIIDKVKNETRTKFQRN